MEHEIRTESVYMDVIKFDLTFYHEISSWTFVKSVEIERVNAKSVYCVFQALG